MNKSIGELDKTIEENGSRIDGFENLKSIKMIGSKGATILLFVMVIAVQQNI